MEVDLFSWGGSFLMAVGLFTWGGSVLMAVYVT